MKKLVLIWPLELLVFYSYLVGLTPTWGHALSLLSSMTSDPFQGYPQCPCPFCKTNSSSSWEPEAPRGERAHVGFLQLPQAEFIFCQHLFVLSPCLFYHTLFKCLSSVWVRKFLKVKETGVRKSPVSSQCWST